MLNRLVLAKYLRLSIEDEREGESNSITNQRSLINDYILKYDDLSEYNCVEFIDDGYSATNFNRPGIKTLLDELKKGRINGIIVKDFSRFSRDYIELGNYLEQAFPFLEIRFISINDGYDSKIKDAVHSGLDVSFKGILYDLYSKDISNKIKSAKGQLMKQGKLSSGSHPYGYLKSEKDNKAYVIDNEAADVVKMIFSLALENKSNIEIARELNSKNILTPGMYKRSKGFYGYGLKNRYTANWDSNKVLKILKDERYTGVLILGQHKSGGIGTGKTVNVPKDEWYKINDSHPEIISKEQFESVQKLKGSYVKKKKSKNIHMLIRKVKCGNCGRFLYHKPSEKNRKGGSFFCKQPHLLDDCDCFTGYIKESYILEALLHTIRVHGDIAWDNVRNINRLKKDVHKRSNEIDLSIDKIESEIENLMELKGDIYRQYKRGDVTKEQFLLKKQLITEKIILFEEKQRNINDMNELNNKSEDEFTDNFKEYKELQELNREIIERLVDVIYVYDVDRIKIKFLYENNFVG